MENHVKRKKMWTTGCIFLLFDEYGHDHHSACASREVTGD